MNLANKYRPKTWSDVVEQPVVVEMLKSLCQQSPMENRNFLLIGSAGVGKTTLARIMANEINHGKGNTIEIDAASNNGAESVRNIVEQAQTYPVGYDYKVFVVDECFSGDTTILTARGYVRFDELKDDDLVAQYEDNGIISFVKPTRRICREHNGDMIKLYPKFGNSYALMTPNHNQPVYNYGTGETRVVPAGDLDFQFRDRLLLSGHGAGDNSPLSAMDRVVIASIADAHRCAESNEKRSRWQLRLTRQRKIHCIQQLLDDAKVEYSMHSAEPGVFEIGYSLPAGVTKNLADWFSIDMGYDRAREFIQEILEWDGSYKSSYPAYFSSTSQANSNFVASVATLAGYSVHVKEHHYTEPTYATEYQVRMISGEFNMRFKPRVKHTTYSGLVYCVEVPSHKIIVQADGFTFVSGNCHTFSPAAWQCWLKCLESNPAKSVFVFATTNPEKIPATILSRVQTFQLSKISLDGVIRRLKFVLDSEKAEGRSLSYTEDAVSFIAKLANGGMRDALTLLDKALAYSSDLTVENLTVALSLPNYDDYFALLQAYAKRNNEAITSIIHKVYNSGANFTKWFEGFHAFVMNIVKYIFMQDINVTVIPSTYADKISPYGLNHSAVCLKLANKLIELNHELKTTQYLQETALTYLCAIPKKGDKQ